MNLTLDRKLTLLVVMLLVVAQCASGLAVWFSTNRYALGQVDAGLELASGVLEDLLQSHAGELATKLGVLADDFAFRGAMATGDMPTIESALANHGDRLGAGLVLYADASGGLVASTHHDLQAGTREFPLPSLLRAGRDQVDRTAVYAIDGEAFLLAVVPVHAPMLVGWVAMGVPFGPDFSRHLNAVTRQHLLVWDVERRRPLAGSLAPGALAVLPDSPPTGASDGTEVRNLTLSGEQFRVRKVAVERPRLAGIELYLLGPLQAARAIFDPLKAQLLTISLVALVLSIALAIATGQAFVRPIATLVAAARRIQSGNYQQDVPVPKDKELGDLASALNQMQQGISTRESQISYQARHDGLTGLANRAVANDRLETAIRRARRRGRGIAVVMVDLDRFKEINDSLGHMAGDAVLQEVARRLNGGVRATDTVCRLGGDEFMVILEDGTEKSLLPVIEHLAAELNTDAQVGELHLRLGASLGIAFYPAHGDTVDQLLRRGDIAMYRAKRESKQLMVYEPGQDEAHLRQVRLMNELPEALEAGQFQMLYQPKADAHTLDVIAAEALIRWQHPELGMVSPDEFITLAEYSGKIRQLTRWVIKQVLLQQAQWRADGIHINTSINLSAMDLMDQHFPELMVSYGRLHEVPAECLTLEITESSIMSDAATAEGVLNRLKRLGYSISIDDFGTGFSSLAQLKRMPVSELKIDKSFVLSMDQDADDATIVRSTIDMARSLGIRVVVEGVENIKVLNMLRNWRADAIQGYFLAKPMAPVEFERWLDERGQERHSAG